MYLSQVLGCKITDSTEAVVGRLDDFVIDAKQSYAPLRALVVRSLRGHKLSYIPYSEVGTLGPGTVLLKYQFKKDSSFVSNPASDILLKQNFLDHQIVDIEGARVVRVNDLKIGLYEGQMCVLGIDVSFIGILRRMGLVWLDIFHALKPILIDWRKAHLIDGKVQLDTVSKDLIKLHPADLANIIEDLHIKHGSSLVESLDSQAAAKVVEELDPDTQRSLLRYLPEAEAVKIIEQMSIDEIVDFFQHLPQRKMRDFLPLLKGEKAKAVEKLLQYNEDTAGGLMTTDYLAVDPRWTVAKVVAEIKRLSASFRSLLYVYVIDEKGLLLGAVSLRRLLIAEEGTTMNELAKKYHEWATLHPDDSLTETVRVMTKYNLFTATVVDENEKLLGVVTIDDVMRELTPRA